MPYPYGHPLGEPGDAAGQTRVLRAMLDLLGRPRGPVLEDFADDRYDGQDINLAQASTVRASPPRADVAFEVTTLRPYYEQWLGAHGGRTAVGVSGVDQRRFRGVVRLLEAYAAGDADADLPERPPAVPRLQFLRWCCDDLKAFYLEARMAQRPDDSFQQLNDWLWRETALAELLSRLGDRLRAAGDPRLEALAFGIAR